jgi:hypothetical protein
MPDNPQFGGPENALIGFYAGVSSDDRGRRLADIQSWHFNDLENVHDYIQWLFPLRKHSPVNPVAPVVDAEVTAAFRGRPELRTALVRSLEVMLTFYGFNLQDSAGRPVVRCSDQFEIRASHWMTHGNHNHRRITRILACLQTLGLTAHAAAFFRALQEVFWSEFQEQSHAISADTFAFWKSAAGSAKLDL